jgi:hypothetical protein
MSSQTSPTPSQSAQEPWYAGAWGQATRAGRVRAQHLGTKQWTCQLVYDHAISIDLHLRVGIIKQILKTEPKE